MESVKTRPVGKLERKGNGQRWITYLIIYFGLVWGIHRALGAVPAVKILPLGDSLTEGCCSGTSVQGAYRTRLYTLLSNAGYNVDFLGTLSDANPPPALGDPNHEGHPGYRIDEVDANLETWLSVIDDPDVILLEIGTNDYAQNHDLDHAIDRLEALVAHLATLRPYAKILVANLIVAADPEIENNIETSFNPFVQGVVNNQAALGRQVYFVDLHSCCDVTDLADPVQGLHPNLGGYEKMGDTWFPAVTSVITPLGTSDPPAILRATGQADLRHVRILFSKPIEDASANTGNFSLNGGVSVAQAVLDSSKRIVTLTTSPQSPNTTYSITINGVVDRTPEHHAIAPNSLVSFQSGPVSEAVNYTLVYSLKIPNKADFNSAGVSYEVDDHASVGAFSRIAYYFELQPQGGGPVQYLWASMNAFTSDATRLGVPSVQSGGFFQQPVTNLNVRSSVGGIVTGDGLTGGNLEFWPSTYVPANSAGVGGASSGTYDWGDSFAGFGPAGYGSMQLHNFSVGQTLFALNGWGGSGLTLDVGIGNSTGESSDWTLARNATDYLFKTLQVYVLSSPDLPGLPVILGQPHSLRVATGSPVAFNASATGQGPLSYQWRFNGTPIGGASGSSYAIVGAQPANAGSYDVIVSNPTGSSISSAAVLTVIGSTVLENGSFESDYAAWMKRGNQGIGSGSPYQASDGSKDVVFNSGNTSPNGVILQSFLTTPGQMYQLDFDAGVLGFNGGQQRMQVIVEGNSTLLDETIAINAIGGGSTRWVPQSLTFLANSTLTTLSFQDVSFATSGLDLLLDNVGVTLDGPELHLLTVDSSNPASGAAISISPSDNNGADNGTTSLVRVYPDGTTVTLTASSSVGSNPFQKWLRDGVDYVTTLQATVLMDGPHTLTAVYGPTVQAVFAFYNRSAWDGNDAGANSADDSAIATDKVPLRPGGIATFSNYISYNRGLNGIMVDISGIPGTITASDFTFKTGNSDTPSNWSSAPSPSSILVRPGAGINGSDRVTLIWPDNSIQKQWLEIQVLATANTGLAEPEIYYFGNAIGESGNLAGSTAVSGADVLQVYNHVTGVAPITANQDFNRDKRVTAPDVLIVYNNLAAGQTALRLINLSGETQSLTTGGAVAKSNPADDGLVSSARALAVPRITRIISDADWRTFSFEDPIGDPPPRVWWSEDLTSGEWLALPAGWASESTNGIRQVRIPIGVAGSKGFFRFQSAPLIRVGR